MESFRKVIFSWKSSPTIADVTFGKSQMSQCQVEWVWRVLHQTATIFFTRCVCIGRALQGALWARLWVHAVECIGVDVRERRCSPFSSTLGIMPDNYQMDHDLACFIELLGSFRFDYRYDYGYESDRLVMDRHIYYMNTSHLVCFALFGLSPGCMFSCNKTSEIWLFEH